MISGRNWPFKDLKRKKRLFLCFFEFVLVSDIFFEVLRCFICKYGLKKALIEIFLLLFAGNIKIGCAFV